MGRLCLGLGLLRLSARGPRCELRAPPLSDVLVGGDPAAAVLERLVLDLNVAPRTKSQPPLDVSALAPEPTFPLSNVLDHLPQGVCVFDASTRIVACNDAYLIMYNLSPTIARSSGPAAPSRSRPAPWT